jgi:hypothetical protein
MLPFDPYAFDWHGPLLGTLAPFSAWLGLAGVAAWVTTRVARTRRQTK